MNNSTASVDLGYTNYSTLIDTTKVKGYHH